MGCCVSKKTGVASNFSISLSSIVADGSTGPTEIEDSHFAMDIGSEATLLSYKSRSVVGIDSFSSKAKRTLSTLFSPRSDPVAEKPFPEVLGNDAQVDLDTCQIMIGVSIEELDRITTSTTTWNRLCIVNTGQDRLTVLNAYRPLSRLFESKGRLAERVSLVGVPAHETLLQGLHQMMDPNQSRLVSLCLHLIPEEGISLATPLCAAIRHASQLTSLDLANTLLSSSEGKTFASALQSNTSITSLGLAHTNIGKCAFALAEMIALNNNITTLDLSSAGLGDAGARHIAQSLLANGTCSRAPACTRIKMRHQPRTTCTVAAAALKIVCCR